MISHEFKLIFVHIPKCAGSSVEGALNHFSEFEGDGRQDHRTIRQIEPLNQHAFRSWENILELARRARFPLSHQPNPKNRYKVTRNQYATYMKFTVVRNPWERIFSWYKSTGGTVADSPESKQEFRDYVLEQAGKGHLRPHVYYLKQFDGRINMDLVIRYESLSRGFEDVISYIGDDSIVLPHLLKNENRKFRHVDFFDSETKEFVKDVYSEDIRTFGFKFDSDI